MQGDTIFALSSGALPAAIAIVRLSGPQVRSALEALCGFVPLPRMATLQTLRDPLRKHALDRAVVLFFPNPGSFTGEDCCEFQCHGSRAVVRALWNALAHIPGCRPADEGEFTRRAFANGRLDLTEVEGLGALLAAHTEAQRNQAMSLASGALRQRAGSWRQSLVTAMAAVEADLDFSDEGDVPPGLAESMLDLSRKLARDMGALLADSQRGERIRDGFAILLAGPPNAGKSTLFNALARRDVAIVSPQAGTTRDLLEVHLDLNGMAVILVDSAGLWESEEDIEVEGIRRMRARAQSADLILWLSPVDDHAPIPHEFADRPNLLIRTKADRMPTRDGEGLFVSASTGVGLDGLIDRVTAIAEECLQPQNVALVSTTRQHSAIERARAALISACSPGLAPELLAEELRVASRALAALVGLVAAEDVLDEIFARFCIGK